MKRWVEVVVCKKEWFNIITTLICQINLSLCYATCVCRVYINMKRIKILLILIVILGIVYYQLDKRLYYYGKHDLHVYHLLPFKIEPEYKWPFEGGFALRDEYGFSIAGNGVSYPVNNKIVAINKVLKYGFNAKHLIALVIDSNKTNYYVNLYLNPRDNSIVKASMGFASKMSNYGSYKWINIDGNDDYIWKFELYRNYLMFIIIILFIMLIYQLIKFVRRRDPVTASF